MAEPATRNHHMCQYIGQPCANDRARGENGVMLHLCEHHRALANRNQQRYRLRRQLERLRQEAQKQHGLRRTISTQPQHRRADSRSSEHTPAVDVAEANDPVDHEIEAWFVKTFGHDALDDVSDVMEGSKDDQDATFQALLDTLDTYDGDD